MATHNQLGRHFAARPHVRLVRTPEELVQNVLAFQSVIKTSPDLVARLSTFKVMYGVKEKGTIVFGPSKFVGYVTEKGEPLTAATYLELADIKPQVLDGRKTEQFLRKQDWWTEVFDGFPITSIVDWFRQHGKMIHNDLRVKLLRSDSEDEETLDTVSLMIKAALPTLSARQKRLLLSVITEDRHTQKW